MDLLDLPFAELLGITWNISLDASPLFLQTREEISEQFEQLVKLVDFVEYSRYFQEIYPSHANSETKKVELFNPSQAKLEEQLEEQHRQGAAVQPYPVIT